jgi:hypothetical protein
MKIFRQILLFLGILLSLQSCYKDVGPIEPEGETPTENVKFSTDIQPIFTSTCVSCHPNSGNLDLTNGNAYNNIVNVNASGYSGKLIIPNDVENSILYKKIDGSRVFGSNMPLGTSLSSGQINTIKQWIIEGALNN